MRRPSEFWPCVSVAFVRLLAHVALFLLFLCPIGCDTWNMDHGLYVLEYYDPYLFTVLFQLPPQKSKVLAVSNATTKASQLGQNLSVTINGAAVLLCVGDLDFAKEY